MQGDPATGLQCLYETPGPPALDMKTLFPKQQGALDFFDRAHDNGHNTLDQSDTGTGKTVVAVKLAKRQGKPLAVICPKAVIPAWRQELAEEGIEATFILNLEALRGGRKQWVTKTGKKTYRWNLEPGTLVFVDEIHKCKGPFSQAAGLLVALVKQGYSIHGMSGTSCEDPTEMRPLGLMLKLHSGDQRKEGYKMWWPWMQEYGCRRNHFKSWELADRSKLKYLRQIMYATTTHRLSVDDFPDSFKLNRIFVQPMEFKENKKIVKAYEELGLTAEIIEDYIENGTVTDTGHILSDITRARRLAEALKVPDICDLAKDLRDEGNSIVIFVNYSETIDGIQDILECPKIDGRQDAEERQRTIEAFQADEEHCIVVNSAAGGTGISLHDTHGNRPRISLITPSFSCKTYMQVLGRIHRNGGKTDAIQYVLVSEGSIEQQVMRSVNRRLQNLKELHNIDPHA